MRRALFTPWATLKREHRTLVFGLGALITLFLVGRLPAWLAWSRAQADKATELQRSSQRIKVSLRSATTTRDSARALRLRLGDEFQSLLRGANTPATEASLLEAIHEAADATDVRIGTVVVRTDTSRADGFYAHPRGALEVTGDVRGVTAFLARLEGSETRLRVISINISQREPFASSRQPEALNLSLTIEGLGRRAVHEKREAGSRTKT